MKAALIAHDISSGVTSRRSLSMSMAFKEDPSEADSMSTIALSPISSQISSEDSFTLSCRFPVADESRNPGGIVYPIVEELDLDQHETSSQSLPQPSYPPTSKDWEAYRAFFTQMYIVENRTLNDVMTIMKEQYDFRATRRMFKQRVADWKLYKNYKDAERVEVTRKVKELERQGRGQSQLFIHMRPAKTQRVARKDSHGQALVARSPPKHREEKKSLPKIAGREGIIDGDLLKRVVMNSSPFRPLSTLPELKDAEMILLHTNIYYDTFSSLGGIVDYPTPHSTISRTHPYALGNKIDTAFKYLKSDQQVAAWRLLNEASDMAKALFTEPHYKLLQIIILEAADWSSNAPTDVYKSYYMFLARMASVILGEGNPISIILSSFTRLSPADRAHEVIYQLALTKIEERLGIDHPDTIEATDQYHTVLGLCGSFEEAEKRQMIQVARLDAVNKYSLNALWALYSLGVTRKDMGDYDGAIIALSDVRDRMRLVVDAGTNRFSYNSVEISAIQELSVSFNAKGMYEETRRVTEETLGRCLGNTEWNRGEWQTTAIVAELHNAYMKLGMLDEADELKRRYPENF